MRKYNSRSAVLPIPIMSALYMVAGILFITYITLLAIIMTYGVVQTQSAQTLSDTRATVGTLETHYLATIKNISATNPKTAGFTKPSTIAYVSGTSQPMVSFLTH